MLRPLPYNQTTNLNRKFVATTTNETREAVEANVSNSSAVR